MPANLACTAVSRSDHPQPTCFNSVRSNASHDGKPRNRLTAPLLLPTCSHPATPQGYKLFPKPLQIICKLFGINTA